MCSTNPRTRIGNIGTIRRDAACCAARDPAGGLLNGRVLLSPGDVVSPPANRGNCSSWSGFRAVTRRWPRCLVPCAWRRRRRQPDAGLRMKHFGDLTPDGHLIGKFNDLSPSTGAA